MNTYWLEAKFQFLSLLRTPRFSVPTLLLPPMFYLFFGILMNTGRVPPVSMAQAILIGYAVFGALAASMWGVAVTLSTERNLGWLEVKRASPMPLGSYFASKIAASMAFSLTILLLLGLLAQTLGHAGLSAAQWLQLAMCVLVASIPLCGMGLLVGTLTSAGATPAVVNLISMPMAICSGLWIPIDFLPARMQQAAVFLPTYHALQIGRTIVGRRAAWPIEWHLAALLGFTLLFLVLTAGTWRRQRR
ncbi:MAG: ABC transporter permease [Paludibaculum sp.]